MTRVESMPWTLKFKTTHFENKHNYIDTMHRLKEREWDDNFTGCDRAVETTQAMNSNMGEPRTNIIETDGLYVITVELPGQKIEDVKVSVTDGILTVKGNRKSRPLDAKGHYLLAERASGPFLRSFTFSSAIRQETMSTGMSDGLLTVIVRKPAQARPSSTSSHMHRAA